MVPGTRLFIHLGLAGTYLGAMVLADMSDSGLKANKVPVRGSRIEIAEVGLSALIIVWLVNGAFNPQYLSYVSYLAALSAVGFSLCFMAMILSRPRLFAFLLASASLFMGNLDKSFKFRCGSVNRK